MTPEIMWKFRRLGTFTLSPDGASVLYTVTNIDLNSEERQTNIYKLSTMGGAQEQLTSDGGNSPQWFNNGKSIAYTTKRLKGIDDAKSTNTDIFLFDITSSKEVNISEGNKGFDKYPVFSPDGSKIAYQSMKRDGFEDEYHFVTKPQNAVIWQYEFFDWLETYLK